MPEKTDQCAHAECHCPAAAGSEYCSDYCAQNKHDPEAGCRCAHQECAGIGAQPEI